MAKSLNSTQIIGNVGGDSTTRFTQAGKQVTSFSVACTDSWTNAKGEKQESTTWFKVTTWEKIAEIAQEYVKKGDKIYVEGSVKVSAYMDKSGQAAASLELTAKSLLLLGGKSNGSSEPSLENVAEEQGAQISNIEF